MQPIRRALLSVSDKSGIETLARALHEQGVEILSTGGTAKLLSNAGIPVKEVSAHTGSPEIMDGRVKTLHPKIHGGILARRGLDDAVMAEHGIDAIDLVVVNLYPFQATIAKPDCGFEEAIENIDIGGPTMLRAAAKNHAFVTVIVNPEDYAPVLESIAQQGGVSDSLRRELAMKCFEHTAAYDGAIANYLGAKQEDGSEARFGHSINLQFIKRQDMRYGENPHQAAAFYIEDSPRAGSIATATQLQGKELSYNNIADTDAALECVKTFSEAPACVIVKHANPCGVALGDNLMQAYERAFATDPTSSFGGIIAFNGALDADTAQAIIDQQFVEVIIAPSIDAEAREVLAAKGNVRVLSSGEWPGNAPADYDLKRVGGGLLVQDLDQGCIGRDELKIVSQRKPDAQEITDLLFAWRVAKAVKSNAIVYARDAQTIGVGAGQMSRIDSARIAGIKAAHAGLEVAGSVMASDAFFPFRDGIDAAAKAGIRAVIQPGGSIRDEEVIAAADEAGMAMVYTGMRHFRH